MNDPEFIDLKNKFFLGLGISLLIGIPLLLFLIIRLDINDSKIVKKIKNQDSFFLFVENNSCKNCKELKNILSEEEIDYQIIKEEESNEYEKIIEELKTNKKYYPSPTIIFIKEGTVVASLPNIQLENDLVEFIENYK